MSCDQFECRMSVSIHFIIMSQVHVKIWDLSVWSKLEFGTKSLASLHPFFKPIYLHQTFCFFTPIYFHQFFYTKLFCFFKPIFVYRLFTFLHHFLHYFYTNFFTLFLYQFFYTNIFDFFQPNFW